MTREPPKKDRAEDVPTNGMLVRLLDATVGKQGGTFGLSHKDDGSWIVSAEYGREAPDSPMVGAAAYGLGSLREALTIAGIDAGLWSAPEGPNPEPTPREQQRRILIVEGSHPAELNLGAVQGSMSLLADADEAYAFSGDKAVCIKHRDFDVAADPFQVAVAIQRRTP